MPLYFLTNIGYSNSGKFFKVTMIHGKNKKYHFSYSRLGCNEASTSCTKTICDYKSRSSK